MDSMYDIGEPTIYKNIIIQNILNNCASKVPIKMSELAAVLNKKKKVFDYCFQLAQEDLKNIHGILLKDISDSKVKKFICYNKYSTKILLGYNGVQESQMVLLILILAYIFIHASPLYEEQIFEFLERREIYVDQDHSYFGSNIRKLITETFVRQLYFKRQKSDSEIDSELKYLYSWGIRAEVEFPRPNMLTFASKIMNKPKSAFVLQYQAGDEDNEDDEDPSQSENA